MTLYRNIVLIFLILRTTRTLTFLVSGKKFGLVSQCEQEKQKGEESEIENGSVADWVKDTNENAGR